MNQVSSKKHFAFLLALLAIYLIAYFAHSALPGNNLDYPLGWWGWFDQGEYLKAAKAIASWDLSSPKYYYPPLYTTLGAPFVWINPMHAFTVLDVACFLIFAHCFISTAKRFVGWGWAAFIFTFTLLFSSHSLQIWVEPWTSSLVAALFAALIAQVDKSLRGEVRISSARLALWSALGGAVFLTRPADAVVISPMFCFILWRVWHSPESPQTPVAATLEKTLVLIAPGLLGIVLFAIFNLVVHGTLGGRYFGMAETNGFHPADLLEKTVSLLLDSGTLYNVPDEAILRKAKWLLLFFPAAIWGLLRGAASIRLIIVLIATQLAIYFPYADLLPTGVWQYHNIHYFKWIFPYAGLIILLWLKATPYIGSVQGRGRLWWASLAFGLLFLSLQLRVDEIAKDEAKAILVEDEGGSYLRVKTSQLLTVDKISIPQLGGDFQAIYFSSSAKVKVGGQELKFVRDYRFLPSKNGVDLLFIRPVKTDEIKIYPGNMKVSTVAIPPQFFEYRFTFGAPSWLR